MQGPDTSHAVGAWRQFLIVKRCFLLSHGANSMPRFASESFVFCSSESPNNDGEGKLPPIRACEHESMFALKPDSSLLVEWF